jgi:ribA/ribD-fused uncharacterized protein
MNKDCTFFWDGPFSQWYPSYFKVRENKIGGYGYGTIMFNCAEQYMMFKKASLFEDHITATLILGTDDPKRQKKYGRGVQGFDKEFWESKCKEIVYDGNIAKFSQSLKLRKALFNTGNTLLVEASPFDAIWGIGLNEAQAKLTPKEDWKGTNWLGEILTRVRDDLK